MASKNIAAPDDAAGTRRLHPLPVRIMHWVNAVAMIVMITSGWGVYDDYVVISGLHFGQSLRLGSWAAESLLWHFAGMWFLAINGLLYLLYGFFTGRFLERLFPIRIADVLRTVNDTLHFRIAHDDLTTYNAVQKILYIIVMISGVSQVVTGLAIWKPIQFSGLVSLLGGFQSARIIHFWGMAVIVGFLLVHVVLSLLVPSTLLAMLAGGPRVIAAAAAQKDCNMKSLFRPDRVPDQTLLSDHKPLLRSLERRGLIRGGLSLGALSMLTGCDFETPGAVETALRKVSDFNDHVQALIFDPNKLAPTYPASMVLKPPKFNAYYDIMDVKPIDGQTWRLELAGLVDNKTPWTLDQIEALPQQDEIIRHICVEGWDYIGEWSGVPMRVFLERVGADTRAKYVNFRTGDDYPSTVDMATALHPQTLLATKYAGETLAAPFGYPLRLRTSTKLGYKNPKWITAIEVTNTYTPGYWEKQGFNWFGGI